MMNRFRIGSLISVVSLVAGVGLARQAGSTPPAGTKTATESKSAAKTKKGGAVMKGFVQDIDGLTVKNDNFRQVLYTAKHCQLVVMALKPKEEIGAEVH